MPALPGSPVRDWGAALSYIANLEELVREEVPKPNDSMVKHPETAVVWED